MGQGSPGVTQRHKVTEGKNRQTGPHASLTIPHEQTLRVWLWGLWRPADGRRTALVLLRPLLPLGAAPSARDCSGGQGVLPGVELRLSRRPFVCLLACGRTSGLLGTELQGARLGLSFIRAHARRCEP